MKTLGIGAGWLVLAAATSAFAAAPAPAYQVPTPIPPDATNPPPGLSVLTPPEATRDIGVREVPAPSKALEIGVQAGYTQGFGAATSDPRVGAGPGGAVGVRLDDRIDPRWSFGVNARYEGYGSSGRLSEPAALHGMIAGVHATYHAQPYSRLDPHMTFGAGYRMLAEVPTGPDPSTFNVGVELGRVEFGLDLRPAESVAVSPVVGADLNLFAWRFGGGATAAPPVGTTLNTFVFAGVEGHFDVGGTREHRPLE